MQANSSNIECFFQSIAAGYPSSNGATAWDQRPEDIMAKFSSLEVCEDHVPCLASAPTQSLQPASVSTITLAAVATSSAMTPVAVSAHSAASAASSFPSDPFPATSDTRQDLSTLSYLQPLQQPSQLQPRASACNVQVPLVDRHVFSEPDTRASLCEAPLAGAYSIGSSPLRDTTSLFGHDSLGDFGLSQQHTYSASTAATYSTEQRSSELRGAFTDIVSWSLHPSSGNVAPGMAPLGSSMGSPGQKPMMMHGMPMQQDAPAHYSGLPQGSRSSFPGASLAGHNRQNVPPNFPQHTAPAAAPRMHQDDVRFCSPAFVCCGITL